MSALEPPRESMLLCRVQTKMARGLIAVLTFLASLANSADAQDTDRWDGLLRAHVSGGRVDYKALSKPSARKALREVMASFADMPESAPLADWINAYNAAVVSGVVEHYPVQSVMDVDGFFKKQKFVIAGKSRTLDDVEHRVIRPRFKDARVHVALNCAALSCPPLHGRAFRTKALNATLNALVSKWLGSSDHVRREGKTLRVSEIFFWFEEDFKREAGSVPKWIVKHAAAKKSDVEATSRLAKIPYDWRLNDKR